MVEQSNGRLPGRPPEDRFRRQLEIFSAVAPLIVSRGARNLRMREAATAAGLSLGGLRHYFATKEELLLFPLAPETCEVLFQRFAGRYGPLRRRLPQRYFNAFVELMVDGVALCRPAMHAAVELGAGDFWRLMQDGVDVELTGLLEALEHARDGTLAEGERERLLRALRRLFFGAMLDRDLDPDHFRADLRALLASARIEAAAVATTAGA
jgi:AcrR family transcriptional regulator